MERIKGFGGVIKDRVQLLLPGERSKRNNSEFVARFQTIKDDIISLDGTVSSVTGVETLSARSPLITDIYLAVPSIHEEKVMRLIDNAGISLPDQSLFRRAYQEMIGEIVEAGLMSPDLEEEAQKFHIFLYSGKNMVGEIKALEIKPQKDT